MSSLFTPKSAQNRPRAISNGGLGGLVKTEATGRVPDGTSQLGTWPRKRQRPTPLQIYHDTDNLLVPTAPWSARSVQSSRSTWSPTTSSSFGKDTMLSTNVHKHHLSPLMSRFNSASSNLVTLETIKPPPNGGTPIELPGSLLLPSQGFPPPPATPSHGINLKRQGTDDSDFSTVPSLTTSVSTASSSDNMDLLKGLSTQHWKASPTHSSHAIVNGNANRQCSTVSKPFSAMSIEELLAGLPKCDSNTIARVWLPEMQKKCSHMKQLLQRSQECAVAPDSELKSIGNVSLAVLHHTHILTASIGH